MYNLFQKPLFLILIFILFTIILNLYILQLLDKVSVVSSFFIVYSFWVLMIIFLFIISRTITKIKIDED